jgi:curved DNA-binding protein CbpA
VDYMAKSVARDAYAILGVDPAVDDEAIAAAYRALARRFHPDIAGDAATRRMSRINAAFDLVRDAHRRSLYDRELDAIDPERAAAARGRRRQAPPPTAEPRRAEARPTAATAYQPRERASERDGTGAAGPPPGRPSGSVLTFGRHLGWSIGEIARSDPGYLVWLEGKAEGRPFREEIDQTLRHGGHRNDADPAPTKKGRFRRS